MTTTNDERKPVRGKLKEFAESIKTRKPIVFCVQCGSTSIDQTAIYKLECSNCGAHALWDGFTFGIARDGGEHDAKSSFENRESRLNHHQDWHFLAIREMQVLSRSIIDLIPVWRSGETEKEGAMYEEMVRKWEEGKARIDEFLFKSQAVR